MMKMTGCCTRRPAAAPSPACTGAVSYTHLGSLGAGYARNMLDAIIQSYCTYYTEKYVEQKLSLNPSSGLLGNGYDYYECIRILENDTDVYKRQPVGLRPGCGHLLLWQSGMGAPGTDHSQRH